MKRPPEPTRTTAIAAWILVQTLLASCTAFPASLEARPAFDAAEPVRAERGLFAVADSKAEPGNLPATSYLFPADAEDASSVEVPNPAERLLVYTAQLQLEVPRLDAGVTACIERATALDGFLASRRGTSLTFRIPADRYDTFLDAIRDLGRVLDESMQVVDVTGARRDTRIRLENARQARTRLVTLLESAEDVEDVLAIEREITRLTEIIEQAEAELRALDDRIALSTVTVTLRTAASEPAGSERLRPSRSGFSWIRRVGIEEVERCF